MRFARCPYVHTVVRSECSTRPSECEHSGRHQPSWTVAQSVKSVRADLLSLGLVRPRLPGYSSSSFPPRERKESSSESLESRLLIESRALSGGLRENCLVKRRLLRQQSGVAL